MSNGYYSLGKEYILQTQFNKERYGKRRKSQLNNLFNRNNINKPKTPTIKPNNLDKNKVVGINKLYPNLKSNKDLDNKSLNDDVYRLNGIENGKKVVDDRVSDDELVYFYNKEKKNLYPKLKKMRNVLLSFKEWYENEKS